MTAHLDVAGLSATACVRVRAADGDVVGSGFLVGPDLVATCAHVVASATGSDPYARAAPTAVVELEFPALPGAPAVRTGRVHRWEPIGEDGTGDVALLRLDAPPPPGAVMPPLRRVDRLWDSRFRVFGFPEGRWDGVWATGRVRGAQGTGWYQLQGDPGDQPIEGGFSGAPVWDDRTGAVIGMTVAADRDPGVTTAYLLPVQAVLGLDPELLPCPYRGLEPFGEEHAGYFFGRDAELARLTDVVSRCPLVAVAGPSGAGKSSLLAAGLVPRLRAVGDQVVQVRPRPGAAPLPSLVIALLGPPPQLLPFTELVAALADPATRPVAVERLTAALPATVLVVDQFEELADTEPAAARDLLDVLAALAIAPDPVRVVLTVRGITLSDVIGPDTAEVLAAGSVFVGPMDRQRLREVIVRPAEQAPGLAFEDGLVDRILDDAGAEPGQLTLVESLLTQLWTRRAGGTLTVRGYEEAGGVTGALTAHAERVVETVLDDGGDPAALRELLTRLAVTRQGRFVRHPASLDQLPAAVAALVPVLAGARLVVVTGAPDGTGTVELGHQSLIEHWPRLRAWLETDRDFLAWRSDLDGALERWEAQGRDEGALLRGGALETAVQRVAEHPGQVTATQSEFVRRGRDRQRREVRRWRTVTAVLAVLVLVAGGLAVVAVTSGNTVREQLRTANASLIADAALARAPTDPAAATQLALAAWRLDPTNPTARSALAGQYLAMRSVEAVFPAVTDGYAVGSAGSDDADVIMAGNPEDFTVVTGVRSGAVQRWDPLGAAEANQAARLSPDGRSLVTVDRAGAVSTWDVRERRGPDRLSTDGHVADPDAIALSADSERVFWLTPPREPGGRELEIWSTRDRAAVAHGLGSLEPDVRKVYPTSDPALVLLGIGGDPANLLAPAQRHVLRSLVDGTTVREFGPGSRIADGGRLVISCVPAPAGSGSFATAVVVQAEQGVELLRFPLHGSDCAYAISNDGAHLVERRGEAREAGYDLARITDLADGQSYEVALPRNAVLDVFAKIDLETFAGSLIVARDGPTRVVVHPQATSILRLRAEPVPPVGSRQRLLDDGRTVIAREPKVNLSAIAQGTRDVVGRMPQTTVIGFLRADRGVLVANLDRSDPGLFFSDHRAPDLGRSAKFALPREVEVLRRFADDKIAVTASENRVVAIDAGVLYAWDRASGSLLRPPVALATDAAGREWYQKQRFVQLRPGRDELAVQGPNDTIEIWDLRQGRRVSTLDLPAGHHGISFAFSADGASLATVTETQMLAILDVDTRELVRPLFPINNAGRAFPIAAGFTADGQVATVSYPVEEQLQRVTLWDPASGRVSGELRVRTPPHDAIPEIREGRMVTVEGVAGAAPFHLLVNAQDWFDTLCAISDRPFTDDERAALPAGASTDRPCSRG